MFWFSLTDLKGFLYKINLKILLNLKLIYISEERIQFKLNIFCAGLLYEKGNNSIVWKVFLSNEIYTLSD